MSMDTRRSGLADMWSERMAREISPMSTLVLEKSLRVTCDKNSMSSMSSPMRALPRITRCR